MNILEVRKIEREIEQCKQKLMDEQPFWAVLATRLSTVVTDNYLGKEVKTAAVDGKHLFINPEFWGKLSLAERHAIFVHEVAHIGLGHHLRRDDRDQGLWNIAGDHEINLILSKQGFALPKGSLCDHTFEGWSAERIFGSVPEEQKAQPPPEGGCTPEDGSGDEDGLDSSDQPGGGTAGDGGAPDESVVPGEVWDPVHPDGSALSEEEKAEELSKLSQDIQMAENAQKNCGGSGDAHRKRATDRIVKPKMKWRNYLSRWITQRGRPAGRSWSRMDRRDLARGIFQPGEIKDGIDWLLIAVDVSSSIAEQEFRAFTNHIEAIRRNVKIERITLLPFNSIVQQEEIVELKPHDKFPKELRIGGGTAFSPIFNWVRRQDKTPDGIIIFTDLCCDDYGEPARTSILWASTDEIWTGNEGWYSNKPPFGEVVQVDLEGR